MDRIKDVLSKTNYIALVLLLLGTRAIVDASLAQALVVFCFSGVYGYSKYLETLKKEDVNADVRAELDKIKNNMTSIMVRNTVKPEEQPFRRMF